MAGAPPEQAAAEAATDLESFVYPGSPVDKLLRAQSAPPVTDQPAADALANPEGAANA